MTTDEIKALVLREAKSAAHARIVLPLYKTAIETLLAREAEVPAAGPWRYDVENAEPDIQYQVWCKIYPTNKGHDIKIGKLDSRSKTWTDGTWRLYVTAFATINPPETNQ